MLKNDEKLFYVCLKELRTIDPSISIETRGPQLYTDDWSNETIKCSVLNAVTNSVSSAEYRTISRNATYKKDYSVAKICVACERGTKMYDYLFENCILMANFPTWFRNQPYDEKLIRKFIPHLEISEVRARIASGQIPDEIFDGLYCIMESFGGKL